LAPGAAPDAIAIEVQGAQTLALDEKGNLVATTESGAQFLQQVPTVYQDVGGQRLTVDAHFTISGNIVHFALGAYDVNAALVIDPVVSCASYSGGSSADTAYGVAVDGAGGAYFTGTTTSTNYPVVTGSYRTTAPGTSNVFVTKMNAAGTALSYSTYLGG